MGLFLLCLATARRFAVCAAIAAIGCQAGLAAVPPTGGPAFDGVAEEQPAPGTNPILRDVFTADPAPLVVGDTIYLYVGRDNAKGKEMFTMPEWLCYSSKDARHWTAHGAVLRPTDFAWGEPNSAWAAQVAPKDGKFYYFVTVKGNRTAPGNNNRGITLQRCAAPEATRRLDGVGRRRHGPQRAGK